jgi:hypothetical protein
MDSGIAWIGPARLQDLQAIGQASQGHNYVARVFMHLV